MIKKEIRIIGIDECTLNNNLLKRTLIIGIVFRGGLFLDGVVTSIVNSEKFNVCEEISKMVINSRYFDELRVIMLPKLIFSNMNVLDLKSLYEKIKLPIIIIAKNKEKFMSKENDEVLKRIDDHRLFKIIGSLKPFCVRFYGIDENEAINILKASCIKEKIPEPLRVAKLLIEAIKEFKKEVKSNEILSKMRNCFVSS